MCEIQRFYIFPINSLVLWIMTNHFACVFFGEKKSIYQCGEVVFVFKVNTCQIRQYISLPSIVVRNRHSIMIAAERSVITLVVNMSTCTTGKA